MLARAPGKIVLWGEYAVLQGAPAAVMAVDRYAEVSLHSNPSHWLFSSKGFLTPGVHLASPQFCHAPAAAMAEQVAQYWGMTELPPPFSLHSDSQGFQHSSGQKLGLGSSAAVCTATYCLMAAWLGRTATVDEAIAIHKRFQGGIGSGLDVAASWHGGIIRYGDGPTTQVNWPQHLYWQVVWTGQAASTPQSLGDFAAWQAAGDIEPLTQLAETAVDLFENLTLSRLTSYTQQLEGLDKAAQLNIFTPQHQLLAKIAGTFGLVYKPCGAGGGDVGFACGEDPHALNAFTQALARENSAQFVPLNLEIAPHGVKVG